MHQGIRQSVRNNKSQRWSCCTKCVFGTLLYILIVFILLFLIIFVIVPLVFKYSVGIQQSIIFPTWVITPKNYSDIEAFGIRGVKNFYVDIEKSPNVTLGVWQILPSQILSHVLKNDEYNFDGFLTNKNYNILLYMHGNGADRTSSIELYEVLRNYFHIFAVDYRGYGDSSKADMTETGIISDITEMYKWLTDRSKSNIYIWGHSLGTGVATHLISNLKQENISTYGLILETPFTSVTDVMITHPIVEVYSYLPWFSVTIINPIIENDLNFDSKKYIVDIDCPIMMLHAKDDDIISYRFATDLYNKAMNTRNATYQGNITYHLFESVGYGHMLIFKAPELPNYVRNFIDECDNFEGRNFF
ncbi:hypothetical protein NQ318_013303 [Aromia moschata]|uniref:AB hydrolase-1 domain-containing protein n=1 Tax=Aromia moschata TaxID=1265417 RepID=A0AAV8XZL4_9CUCU|nr:hypothetical protein NQ318_013303 [Aromia moschata]